MIGAALTAPVARVGGAAAGAPAAPRRIASLDYGLAETMLALGTAPIALPDVGGWAKWVVEPRLPPGIANLGADQEVNLELLASLSPEIILTTSFLDALIPTLTRIAPCENIDIYAAGAPGPLRRAEAAMRKIGALLGAPDRAEAVLGESVAQFAADRARLAALAPAPVLLLDFLDPRHVRVYAAGSLWQDVLDRLAWPNAWGKPTTYWGFSTVGIEALAGVPDDTLLATFAPVPPDVLTTLNESALWRALPFVRRGRMLHLPTAFVFGTVPSALRFSRLLTDSLIAARSSRAG